MSYIPLASSATPSFSCSFLLRIAWEQSLRWWLRIRKRSPRDIYKSTYVASISNWSPPRGSGVVKEKILKVQSCDLLIASSSTCYHIDSILEEFERWNLSPSLADHIQTLFSLKYSFRIITGTSRETLYQLLIASSSTCCKRNLIAKLSDGVICIRVLSSRFRTCIGRLIQLAKLKIIRAEYQSLILRLSIYRRELSIATKDHRQLGKALYLVLHLKSNKKIFFFCLSILFFFIADLISCLTCIPILYNYD
jgi:hypothetical protein